MQLEIIKEHLLSNTVVADFPEMKDVINRSVDRDGASWDYVIAGCEAVGGSIQQSMDCACTNYCMLQSIHLIDDLLDNDPRGLYHKLGTGITANMALAFQALGNIIIMNSPLPIENKIAIQHRLSQMMLDTSIAQHNELKYPLLDEAKYWNNIQKKSPPLFCSALFSGALSGGADISTAKNIAELGNIYGQMIQIGDDLNDVFNDDDSPDWSSPEKNLALIYTLLADHEDKIEFLELMININNVENLLRAKAIIVKCGAYSYCIYHLLAFNKQGRELISNLNIPSPERLWHLLDLLINPALDILRLSGMEQTDIIFENEFKLFESL